MYIVVTCIVCVIQIRRIINLFRGPIGRIIKRRLDGLVINTSHALYYHDIN